MAKSSGIGARFLTGGYDISGDVNALDTIGGTQALLDSTDITQSAHSRIPGLRDGTMKALSATGGVLTSAGIILAGTFLILLSQPVKDLAEISIGVALGVLIDTFLVRTALVPGLSAAHAAPAAHSQSADAKSDTKAGDSKSDNAKSSGKRAGNGSSSTGKSEALLVAEVLLLLVVGRVLGEGMQRIGQPPVRVGVGDEPRQRL